MKIYTNIALRWDEDEQAFIEESSESYEYAGPVAEAKGGGDTTQVQKADPWSKQQPYLEDLFGRARSLVEQGAPDAGRSSTALQDYINTLQGTSQNLTPFLGQARQSNQYLMDPGILTPESNPALQAYIDSSNEAIAKQFTTNVLPQITSQGAATNNIGSSRQGVAEAIASRDFLDTVQRNTSQLASQGYGQGLDAYTRGLALAPQTAQLRMMPAGIAKDAFAARQVQETLPQSRELESLRAYQSLIGGGGYGGTQTASTPYESGGLTGALGGAAVGAGVASAMPAAYSSMNPWIIGAAMLLGYMS